MNPATPWLALASSVFIFTGEAFAQYCTELPIQPIPSINNKCPNGYNKSNGYCVPNREATPVLFNTKDFANSCPPMFVKDNGYCKAVQKEIGSIIPPITQKCPIGYILLDGYCKQSCSRINF